jgi:hypothetical protein
MIEFSVDVSGAHRGLELIEKNIRLAASRALHPAAERVLIRLHRNMSAGDNAGVGQIASRTGQLRAQTQIRYFLKGGFIAASIKTRGSRSHIARFLENGTNHIEARKVFELTWRSVERQAQVIFAAAFAEEFQALNKEIHR